ncbi:type II secretion system protein [Streptomyces sp. NPDC048659]|uniref:type II secretion system protein n=1 Tax=Streptomyces sp. NPDC048659 TaxID=3155489 RepID=UPI003428722C
MTARRPSGRAESGFTLTELLVTIVIVGVIGTLLSRAFVMGLRFTADTERRISATGAAGALNRFFYGDVQSADRVSTAPACGVTDVIVRLSGGGTDVVYTYEPSTGTLTRVRCTGEGTVTTMPLGRLPAAPQDPPVTLSCGAESPCTSPLEVTLTVRNDPAAPPTALTAVRRSGAS